jgi:hypothetical protein
MNWVLLPLALIGAFAIILAGVALIDYWYERRDR